jgi:hypothetical protein
VCICVNMVQAHIGACERFVMRASKGKEQGATLRCAYKTRRILYLASHALTPPLTRLGRVPPLAAHQLQVSGALCIAAAWTTHAVTTTVCCPGTLHEHGSGLLLTLLQNIERILPCLPLQLHWHALARSVGWCAAVPGSLAVGQVPRAHSNMAALTR